MKRIVQCLFASLVVALFAAAPTYAQTCPSAPVSSWFGSCLYDDYTPPDSCLVTSGVTSTTLSCGWNTSDFEYGTPGKVSYTFTVLDTYNSFDVITHIDFDDPYDDWYNQVEMYATVSNSGGSSTTWLFQHNGTMGDLSCAYKSGSFQANQGDTVTITIEGYNFFANRIASRNMTIYGNINC